MLVELEGAQASVDTHGHGAGLEEGHGQGPLVSHGDLLVALTLGGHAGDVEATLLVLQASGDTGHTHIGHRFNIQYLLETLLQKCAHMN